MAKIAIVYYSMHGHIRQLAEAEKKGVEAAGGTADLFEIPETLPQEVLTAMKAPAKPEYGTATGIQLLDNAATLTKYDGFLIGIPTRFGNFPAQWRAFWDTTGGLWFTGGLYGKFAGIFISTGGQGGGQESTALAAMSTFAHHGIRYVPLGYGATPQLSNLEEVHGGSPWGAGTFAGPGGLRQPSELELEVAKIQGSEFYKTVAAKQVGVVTVTTEKPSNGAESKTTAAPAANKAQTPKKSEDKDTFCGLPVKCVVL